MMGPFDPERILRALSKRAVRYILVGATAARLQGFPRLTAAADITPATDPGNLKRLSEGLAFDCDAETLARANVWNLTTDAGRLDLIFKPGGTQGYDDLARSAVTYQAFGIELRAASLNDIL